MKKLIKLCTLLLVLMLSVTSVFAEETTVTFNGESGFTFSNEGDLFAEFKTAMPGDELTQIVKVKNASGDTVKIYLRAVEHDEENQPVTADATSDESNDFLSQLSMTVKNGDETIYEASPDQTDGLSEDVLLGQFAPGDEATLTVTLSVPIELGNEYAYRAGEVDWVFTAVSLIDVKVNKVWDDEDDKDEKRPDSVIAVLLANGDEIAEGEITEADGWVYIFKDLPSTDMDGNPIEYTVDEREVEEYQTSIKKNDELGYDWTITNYHEVHTPPTGDADTLGLGIIIQAVSLIGMIMLFISSRRKEQFDY